MTALTTHQLTASPEELSDRSVRTQYAALCYRVSRDKPEILLVTSRGTGRWLVPKGWPIDGHTPAETAQQEAWEEAGVIGQVKDVCLGLFSYEKVMEGGRDVPCMVTVYPVKVKSLADRFPEKGQRRRKWFAPKKAALKVAEPELARILSEFDPRML